MHLTCNSSNLNYSRLCPTPPPLPCHRALLLWRFRKKGQSELLTGSTFLFSLAQDQGHFCKSSPTAPPPGFVPCSPQSLIFLLDCWSKPLGYLHLVHIANDSPLSCHLQGLKRQSSPRGAVRHQSHQTLWAFPKSSPAARTHHPRPARAREDQAGPLPRQRRLGAILLVLSFANLAHLVSGTEASDQRECSYEVFFFSSLSS